MPLFEYAPVCTDADEATNPCCHFELLQSGGEEPLSRCPTCGHAVTRIFSAFGIGAGSTPSPHSKPCGDCTSSCDSAAGRVARMATGHVCRAGCKH